ENGSRDMVKILKRSVDSAILELQKKKVFVPELVEYDVLDAGGIGFILIINSWANSIGGIKRLFFKLTSKEIELETSGVYCINVRVKLNDDHELEYVKEKLSEIGDSIVVVKRGGMMKIHIHSSDISRVRNQISFFGEIVDEKISPA
ncbi:MAG: hypothetical protein J7K98_00600, partial [Candidatus Aenigmarchaeota archaeon]|nr:hypothetical protein [Candidatus Aenigmarchaeota archaeon]